MIGLFQSAYRGTHLSDLDAESLHDKFIPSIQRAETPATAVLYSQQRQLDAA
jgi:hypothetical protein